MLFCGVHKIKTLISMMRVAVARFVAVINLRTARRELF